MLGVEELVHTGFARSATRLGRRYPGFQSSPLVVPQVGKVSSAFHISFYAYDPFWNREVQCDETMECL